MRELTGFEKYQTDRGLDKREFNVTNECVNIAEELLELNGLDVPKNKRNDLLWLWEGFVQAAQKKGIALVDPKFDHEISLPDAFSDIKNFCTGGQMKLGYDPVLCDIECAKEVNSRDGKIINGKFEKDLSEEAQAKWYDADYKRCKFNDEFATNEKILGEDTHISSMLDDKK